MDKKQALEIIESKPNMSKGELKALVNSITLKGQIKLKTVKLGDIFAHKWFCHPALVISRIKRTDNYVCLIMTTTPKECFMMTEVNHRFHETQQYVTNAICVIDKESIADNYMYSVETKELNRIKKLFKDFIVSNLL